MYRTVDCATWTDPKVRRLTPEAKLLFVYLFTNSHTHVSGIYYLPREVMSKETGIKEKTLDTLCHTLSELELASFDIENEVVWVRKMFDRQGKGKKNNKSAAEQLKNLHNSLLIKDFLQFYAHRQIPYTIPYGIPYSGFSISGTGTGTETVSGTGTEEGSTAASESPTVPPSPAVLIFPTTGKIAEWPLTESQLAEWRELFPAVDVLGESRAALAWVKANWDKRKTASGMAKFLVRWFTRTQDRGGVRSPPSRDPRGNVSALQEYLTGLDANDGP